MELLKDYDCTIEYHLGKANVVADALSRKNRECTVGLICHDMDKLVALRAMNVSIDVEVDHLLAVLQIKPSLEDQIQEVQLEDAYLKKMKEKVEAGLNKQFTIREDGMFEGKYV